ncbi:hypothetical protein NT6N_07640 [Oceaniferula spumae]|uniref:Peptidyl-prolyl cis-trans isomerase n=1 Tax=Oceaniferula spumae TaxID=2979115 RepID=A0AAT9FIA7_9BACT
MTLIVVGLVALCFFLVARVTDPEGSEVDKNKKSGIAEAERTGTLNSSARHEARSSRRSNQANKRPDTVTTESGLTYQVLREGSGQKPGPKDTVKVAYRGWIQGGDVFDQSPEGKPSEFPLNMVIKGWQEGVQLMRVGAKYRFTIPPDLGYGTRGAGSSIPPNATLVFDVELMEVK